MSEPPTLAARWFARARFEELRRAGVFATYEALADAAQVSRRSVDRFFAGGKAGAAALAIAARLAKHPGELAAVLDVTNAVPATASTPAEGL